MSKNCNICGEENQDISNYCHMCGFKFGDAIDDDIALEKIMERKGVYRQPLRKKKKIKKKTLLLIVIGVIILITLGYNFKDKIPTGSGSNNKDLEKMLKIMGMQENQKREDTRFFDPSLDFKYSDNPYFNNQKQAPANNGKYGYF